jgi:cysteine desulfurase/selenocysteine lyase
MSTVHSAPASGTASRDTATLEPFDAVAFRKDFPALHQAVHGKPLVYLDNAATAQTPLPVVNAIRKFYLEDCANVHRGVHELSQRATDDYENARVEVQKFLGAADSSEIIYTRGTTESINLVAHSYGRTHVQAGDEVLISAIEHHSNIVPWQMLCDERGAKLRVAPINESGELRMDAFKKLLTDRTRIVAVTHVSNALGTVNPVRRIVELAHRRGVAVLLDGAQAVPHMKVNVRELGCDFYAFSGHKMFGPTGIGILYGKRELLQDMPPYQGGGDMIASVTFEKTTYNALPYKFEAGTPNIADAIGLGETVRYLNRVGLDRIAAYEHELLAYATKAVGAIPGVRLIGTAAEKASVLSFLLEGVHAHDLGTILDREGVAIRAGHHCAQPVMDFYGVAATARASLAFYNTRQDIDRLVEAIGKAKELFD